MQRGIRGSQPVSPIGPEAYLPLLLTVLARIAVIVALVWFIVIALPLRERIPLPRPTIPGAIAAAGALALFMLWRVVASLRAALRAWRSREKPTDGHP
ncbi:MAG: hypothetical protein FJY88_04790 [Candidatus Eisenbacteria bacterium]|nr:hypothetical protein [Candidatus Eisenbacteria bacterium]